MSVELASEQRIKQVSALIPGASIYIIGICGTGMGAVASLLKQLGFKVSGSDKAFYPPMGDFVRKTADKIFESYNAENLNSKPDLVVIGNSVSKDNPEVVRVLAEKIPYASMPEVFSALLIGTREHCPTSIVISGTHGKTTTSALVATMFDSAGRKPGYFIGGIPKNLSSGIRPVDLSIAQEKRVVVLEGDEYDSAFFAKWAKFQSYRPDILAITSLEFDHADIYRNIEEIEEQFLKVILSMPKESLVLICDEGEGLQKFAKTLSADSQIKAQISFYGENETSEFYLIKRAPTSKGGQDLEFQLGKEKLSFTTKLSGKFNALNLLVGAAVGKLCELKPEEIKVGLSEFEGVLRRQNVIFDKNEITLIEDFAHHPTAVSATITGIKESYPARRLIAVFEPRSNTSRRAFFQDDYAKSFNDADLVVIKDVEQVVGYSKFGETADGLDVKKLVTEIGNKKGLPESSFYFSDVPQIKDFLFKGLKAGDVILLMSNGDFGGLPQILSSELKKKFSKN
jgi:UDP-N-acetylmuramate: L-alanyl-gamma-D-glutamyl-meso-diaminopimelate ligase